MADTTETTDTETTTIEQPELIKYYGKGKKLIFRKNLDRPLTADEVDNNFLIIPNLMNSVLNYVLSVYSPKFKLLEDAKRDLYQTTKFQRDQISSIFTDFTKIKKSVLDLKDGVDTVKKDLTTLISTNTKDISDLKDGADIVKKDLTTSKDDMKVLSEKVEAYDKKIKDISLEVENSISALNDIDGYKPLYVEDSSVSSKHDFLHLRISQEDDVFISKDIVVTIKIVVTVKGETYTYVLNNLIVKNDRSLSGNVSLPTPFTIKDDDGEDKDFKMFLYYYQDKGYTSVFYDAGRAISKIGIYYKDDGSIPIYVPAD